MGAMGTMSEWCARGAHEGADCDGDGDGCDAEQAPGRVSPQWSPLRQGGQ